MCVGRIGVCLPFRLVIGRNDQRTRNLGVGTSSLHVSDNLVNSNSTLFHLDSLLEVHELNSACDKGVTLLYGNRIYQSLCFRVSLASLS